MNLLEYEAKSILGRYGVLVPKSTVIHSGESTPLAPIVLKSQVHTGGRGKAGGIRVIKEGDTTNVAASLFDLEIKGEKPSALLAEEMLDIAREYYLSLVINRAAGSVELIAHEEGGVEIESQDHEAFFRRLITRKTLEGVGDALADYLDLPDRAFTLQDLIDNLSTCFVKEDAILLEINPLILTTDGKLIAGDCKMTLDTDAAFRHKDWDFAEKPSNANFVTLDTEGTIATIANGAGLAMATVDAVQTAGLTPANFLDVGGGATVESMVASFRQIAAFPQVSSIIINIFGGIVRCDEVAKAIIEARKQVSHLPDLYIRLTGTNSDVAEQLLKDEGLSLYPTLADCLQGVARA